MSSFLGGGGSGSGGGRTILNSDTTYYVRTTGSDSNGGTNPTTDAWATTDHASAFIAQSVDSGGHNIIIDIGAGTFVGWGFRTTIGGGNFFWRGAGSASTTIGPGPRDLIFNFGENISFFSLTEANIYINAVTIGVNNLSNNMISAGVPGLSINLADLFSFAIDIQFNFFASCNPIVLSAPIFLVTGTGHGGIMNGNSATIANVFAISAGAILQDLANWQINSGFTIGAGGAFVSATNGAQYESFGNNFSVNAGTVTGTRYLLASNSAAAEANNDNPGQLGPNFFPGNADGQSDPSCCYDGYFGVVKGSGVPTTTQFPDPNTGGFYKDTSGGGVYAVYNDAGTIKKVALT